MTRFFAALWCVALIFGSASAAEPDIRDEEIDWDAVPGDNLADDDDSAGDDDDSVGEPRADEVDEADEVRSGPVRLTVEQPRQGDLMRPVLGPARIAVPPTLLPVWEGLDGGEPEHKNPARRGKFVDSSKLRCAEGETPGVRGTPAHIPGGELAQMALDMRRATSVAPPNWDGTWVYTVGTSTLGSAVIYCIPPDIMAAAMDANGVSDEADLDSKIAQAVEAAVAALPKPEPVYIEIPAPSPKEEPKAFVPSELLIPIGSYISGTIATWGPHLEVGVIAIPRFSPRLSLGVWGGVGIAPAPVVATPVNLGMGDPSSPTLTAHWGLSFRLRLEKRSVLEQSGVRAVRFELQVGGLEAHHLRFNHGWTPYQGSFTVPLGMALRFKGGAGASLSFNPGIIAGRVPQGYVADHAGQGRVVTGPGYFVAPTFVVHLEFHWMWTGWYTKAPRAQAVETDDDLDEDDADLDVEDD